MRQDFNMRCGRCGRETDGFCEYCAIHDRMAAPVTYQMLISAQQGAFSKLLKMISHKIRNVRPESSRDLYERGEELRRKSIESSARS